MEFIFKILKRLIIAAFMLYVFNKIAVNLNLIIPINLYTIGFVSIFNIFGIVLLVSLKLLG